jgi:carbamoyltransferase
MSGVVLGLNAHHADAAAVLVIDGQVVAAAEEERFRRIKHYAGFPEHALRWCLEAGAVTAADLDCIAINTDRRVARWARLAHALRHWPDPRLVLGQIARARARGTVGERIAAMFPGARVRATVQPIEHHLAHLASAFLPSPFERAAVVSVDGMGDFASAAAGLGEGSKLTLERRIAFPHSLGIFYQALTQFLGFTAYGDEYKVMGLAPYGEPRYAERLRDLIALGRDGGFELDLRYFTHARQPIAGNWSDGVPRFAPLFTSRLSERLGPPRAPEDPIEDRHRDLAASIQQVFETALFAFLRAVHARYRVDALCLAGGCAQNSVANGRLLEATPFRELYVAAAGYDAGGALGAALQAAQPRGAARPRPMLHAALGPEFDPPALARAIEARRGELVAAGCTPRFDLDETALDAAVVERLLSGGVVGWFQGRMEWGPRALGQRSILADPRRADTRELLNRKIKRRESFRPFAPSVLREHVGSWFLRAIDSPFMAVVLPIRPERRSAIPAVTHVDGSGRLQTVTRTAQPRYHALIERFYARTGVPMLLNTSFNENEPIVCRPEEAIDCFLRTHMDVLALGPHLIERPVTP